VNTIADRIKKPQQQHCLNITDESRFTAIFVEATAYLTCSNQNHDALVDTWLLEKGELDD
jgi:hypothetical protein